MKTFHTFARFLWEKQLLPRSVGRPMYKRLVRQNKGADFPFRTDFFGIEYCGNLNNNIDYNIYFYGAFEKPLLYFLSDTMRSFAPSRQGVFVDVGANVGQHSLYMSQHSAQVHAFEPYAPVRQRLDRQISHNGIRNIQVHPLGLSDSNARLPFYAPTGNNAGIGSFDAGTVAKGNKAIGELELVRGDDFFAGMSLDRLDVLKIDVEGFEKPALDGLRQTMVRHRPIVVCEMTYGKDLSFKSREEILQMMPENYALLTFDKRKADGSKARRKDGRARWSGEYALTAFERLLPSGQDDVICCPGEKLARLPQRNLKLEI